jgi:hypothetical protein
MVDDSTEYGHNAATLHTGHSIPAEDPSAQPTPVVESDQCLTCQSRPSTLAPACRRARSYLRPLAFPFAAGLAAASARKCVDRRAEQQVAAARPILRRVRASLQRTGIRRPRRSGQAECPSEAEIVVADSDWHQAFADRPDDGA